MSFERTRFFALAVVVVCGLGLGCDDQPPVEEPLKDGPLPTGLLSDNDLPVPADYEDEMNTTISANNYKAELDAIEKEIESAN